MLQRITRLLKHSKKYFSFPSHEIIKMPALSPTMKEGVIVSWDIKEGQEISEGDILANIETDKATIDFDNQDSGYVAKILKDSGSDKVAVGSPLFVLVEDESDIPAFSNFTLNDV